MNTQSKVFYVIIIWACVVILKNYMVEYCFTYPIGSYLLFVEEHFWRWGETTLITEFMASESLLPDGTNEIVVYHW